MRGILATATDLLLAHTALGTAMTVSCWLPELAPQGHTVGAEEVITLGCSWASDGRELVDELLSFFDSHMGQL